MDAPSPKSQVATVHFWLVVLSVALGFMSQLSLFMPVLQSPNVKAVLASIAGCVGVIAYQLGYKDLPYARQQPPQGPSGR